MPQTSSQHAEPQKQKPLAAWQRTLCYVGLFISVCLLGLGATGITIVLDKEQKNWISRTPLGELWRYLMTINVIFVPAVMNAGIVGCLLCGHNLQWDHNVRFGNHLVGAATAKAANKKQRAKKVA